jgi:archaellum component FlaF (FlaF/FlaG flagellin family)
MKLSAPFCSRIFSVVAALLCSLASSTPTWAQFETRATNPFPEGAYSIASGDFNHDGKLDIVMTVINGFAVALGNGDGTFQNAVFYPTPLFYSLAVADFNGDGNLDIVTADQDQSPSTVSVYLGNGDGTFKTPPITSNTTAPNEFIAVGDFNGDGKPDVVVIENPYIGVLLGNGDGTFGPPIDNVSFVGAQFLAVADFNNDHKADLLVTGSFGSEYTIGVLLGNGDGTLQSAITQSALYVPATVAAGDLNGDGKMDAVLGYDLGGIAVLLGNGDGTLQPPVVYDTTGLGGGQVVVHDLNLDGKLDVAVPSSLGYQNGPPGVDVFWGNGDGTLQPAELFESTTTGLPVVGDLNGDGKADLALGNSKDGVGTMLNTGVVSFSPTTAITFLAQLINTKSPAQTVTLTNNGKSRLSISSIKVSGPFKASSTCGASLAAGAKCTISALFQPTIAGSLTGLVTLVDSASTKPQYVELLGSGTATKLSPTSLNFGTQKVGTQSSSQVVTATNEGSTTVQFSSLSVIGADWKDFPENNTCTTKALQPGASCTATITFAPTTTGARTASLYFNEKEPGASPQPVTLTGTGD